VSREVIIKIRDDLDRTLDADEEVRLGVDDVTYILDLTTAHAAQPAPSWRRGCRPPTKPSGASADPAISPRWRIAWAVSRGRRPSPPGRHLRRRNTSK
jgi:hypothetical protein